MSFSATVTAAPEDVAGALLGQVQPAGQQEAFAKAVELAAGAVSWLGEAQTVSVSVSGHAKENPEGTDLPSLAISMYVATPIPAPVVTEDAPADAAVVPPFEPGEPVAAETTETEAQAEETSQADASQTSGEADAAAGGEAAATDEPPAATEDAPPAPEA